MLKNKCVCFQEIIWFIIMKMMIKMKNIPNRYNTSRSRSRHKHKFSNYKVSQYDDGYTYKPRLEQHLKLNSWPSPARLTWKKSLLIKNAGSFITFPCNAESFAIAFLVFLFVLVLPSALYWWIRKVFFFIFYHLLPKMLYPSITCHVL